MGQEKLLSVLDIASELNTGKATINYLLKRFEEYIPCSLIDGQALYPETAVTILICIQKEIDAGQLPTQIEEKLSNGTLIPSDNETNLSNTISQIIPEEDIKLSSHGLKVLKTVFKEISEQQQRIAKAHEDRAKAEERKAVAIEKRAEAEDKKAAAMNNIANALQEMNRLRSNDAAQQIAHEAAAIIATDETQDLDSFQNELDDIASETETNEAVDLDVDIDSLLEDDDLLDDFPSSDALSDDLEPALDETPEDIPEEETQPLDDLSSLIDEELTTTEDTDADQTLDDLSLLLDEPLGETPTADLSIEDDTPISEEDTPTDHDNLYDLIDESPEPEDTPATPQSSDESLDDLSRLIDDQATQDEPEISSETQELTSELDDLSALIDQTDEKASPDDGQNDGQLDDLSALISDSSSEDTTSDTNKTDAVPELDDLSALIETDTQDESSAEENQEEQSAPNEQLDDLSKLISTDSEDKAPPEPPAEDTLSIDISPEDDLQAYKAAVMQIIIKLKQEDGLSEEQTTEKLNTNKIKTLSGKPEWSQKAISQIYKFIDSAK